MQPPLPLLPPSSASSLSLSSLFGRRNLALSLVQEFLATAILQQSVTYLAMSSAAAAAATAATAAAENMQARQQTLLTRNAVIAVRPRRGGRRAITREERTKAAAAGDGFPLGFIHSCLCSPVTVSVTKSWNGNGWRKRKRGKTNERPSLFPLFQGGSRGTHAASPFVMRTTDGRTDGRPSADFSLRAKRAMSVMLSTPPRRPLAVPLGWFTTAQWVKREIQFVTEQLHICE